PRREQPSLARSGAAGDSPIRASSQGLTVCRSDEATSTGLAARRLRRWLLAIDAAKLSGAPRVIAHWVSPLAKTVVMRTDAAIARQPNGPKREMAGCAAAAGRTPSAAMRAWNASLTSGRG